MLENKKVFLNDKIIVENPLCNLKMTQAGMRWSDVVKKHEFGASGRSELKSILRRLVIVNLINFLSPSSLSVKKG